MKTPLLPVLLFFLVATCAWAQTPPATADEESTDSTEPGGPAPPPGSTVITSDELHMDEVNHIAVFTGNVLVTGTNFSMKCQEMTVNFDKAGKVDTIVSKGDVSVVQPGRVTHSGQAVYTREEDKFDLTDQPVIVDSGKTISAPEIIIYRTRQSLFTKGKSRVIIPEGNSLSSTPASQEQK